MNSKSLRPLVLVGALLVSGGVAAYAQAAPQAPDKPASVSYVNPPTLNAGPGTYTVTVNWTAPITGPAPTHYVIRREGVVRTVVSDKDKKKGKKFKIPGKDLATVDASTLTYSDTVGPKITDDKGNEYSVTDPNYTVYLTYKVRASVHTLTPKGEKKKDGKATSTPEFKLSSGVASKIVAG